MTNPGSLGFEQPNEPSEENRLYQMLERWIAQHTPSTLTGAESMAKSTSMAALAVNPVAAKDVRSMDPRLQYLTVKNQSGERLAATASSDVDEVAVIARVSDLQAWENLSEVRIGATIGQGRHEGESIVTGRIPASRIGFVHSQDFVKSLKAAQELKPTLHATIQETAARGDLLPTGHETNGGAGVVVGIVDYGGDFAHQNFRNSDGSTRLLSIWDQDAPSSPNSPFGYGREYRRAEIDAALNTTNPYSALGYVPSSQSHGTHVMDIAAGNGRGSRTPGVAPEADLIFVDVSHADIPFEGTDVVHSSFGDSTRLLEACKYIFDEAGNRPCVINVSLGTNGGPHDGSTLVEMGLDSLLEQQPNRAVCIAASNSYSDGIHAAGTVAQDEHVDLQWVVSAGDRSQNEFELWYSGDDHLDLELIAPDGTNLGRINTGDAPLPLEINNRMVLFVTSRLDEPNNHDNVICVFMERRFPGWNPAGTWTLRIHGSEIENGQFHAWIERDNSMPSHFSPPHDNTHTLGSISCGQSTFAVGSYDAHKTSRPLSFFSSAGPTRDGREKPELSAPGHHVIAANARSMTGTTRKSGTSMASPAVAGICALVLAEAQSRGIHLSIDKLREIVIASARRNPPSGSVWHDRYGSGRISANAAVQEVVDRATDGETPSPKKKSSTKKASKRKSKSRKRAKK